MEWNLDELFEKSIKAIENNEENIEKEIKILQKDMIAAMKARDKVSN